MNANARPRIVIIGGGFGGLKAAESLARLPVQITVLDRKNHHTFQPLLYQVATAGISPAEIAAPIRDILAKHENVEVLLGEVLGFDLERRVVKVHGFELPYDYLIVAAGATHAYFGHDEWEPLAPGLKTIEDALEIRRRILLAYELAEREAAHHRQASAAEFRRRRRRPDRRRAGGNVGRDRAQIAGRKLPQHRSGQDSRVAGRSGAVDPDRVSRRPAAQRVWSNCNISASKFALNSPVTEVRSGEVRIGDDVLPAEVVLWAAGVSASPLGRALGVPVDRAGRVFVEPDLSIPGHREVFVIGDLASLKDAAGKPLPGVAPVAMQQGQVRGAADRGRSRGSVRARRFITLIKVRWRRSAARPLSRSLARSISPASSRGWRGCSSTSCFSLDSATASS